MNSRNLQINLLIKGFAWMTAVSFVLCGLFYKSISLDLTSVGKIVGLTAFILILLWRVFEKWAWKWKILKPWLINYPDLNGTWVGTLTKESTGTVRPIQLVIHQSLTKMSCVYRSETGGINRSYAESIVYDTGRQEKRLVFSYHYYPNRNINNSDHKGTCDLDISGIDNNRRLNGRYWTCRNQPTTGTISLRFHSKTKYDAYQLRLGAE